MDAMKETIPPCDYYCDTLYLLPYSTFVKLPSGFIFPMDLSLLLWFLIINCFSYLTQSCNTESRETGSETSSTISSEIDVNGRSEVDSQLKNAFHREENKEPELKLLDLYSGCGAMSTGLCLGGVLSGSNIVTVSPLLLHRKAIDWFRFLLWCFILI